MDPENSDPTTREVKLSLYRLHTNIGEMKKLFEENGLHDFAAEAKALQDELMDLSFKSEAETEAGRKKLVNELLSFQVEFTALIDKVNSIKEGAFDMH